MILRRITQFLAILLLPMYVSAKDSGFFSFMDWCGKYALENGMSVIGFKIMYPSENETRKSLAAQLDFLSIGLHSWLESGSCVDDNVDEKQISDFLKKSLSRISSDKYAFVVLSKGGQERVVYLIDPDSKEILGTYTLSPRSTGEELNITFNSIVNAVKLLENAMPHFSYSNSIEGYVSFENRYEWSVFFNGKTVAFSFYGRPFIDGGGLDVIIDSSENRILSIAQQR